MVITSTFFLSKLLLVHFFLTLEGIFYYYFDFHFVYFCTVSTEFIFRVGAECAAGSEVCPPGLACGCAEGVEPSFAPHALWAGGILAALS